MHPIAPRPTILAALLLIAHWSALLRLPCQTRRSRHTRAHPTAVSRFNPEKSGSLVSGWRLQAQRLKKFRQRWWRSPLVWSSALSLILFVLPTLYLPA